jgi:hypothetical protein
LIDLPVSDVDLDGQNGEDAQTPTVWRGEF